MITIKHEIVIFLILVSAVWLTEIGIATLVIPYLTVMLRHKVGKFVPEGLLLELISAVTIGSRRTSNSSRKVSTSSKQVGV